MASRRALLWLLLSLASQIGLAADAALHSARVGYLMPGMPNPVLDAFVEGMSALGYVEGRNLIIEQRWAKGRLDDLPRLAQELVDLDVDVIVTATVDAARAAHRATKKIPIVIGGSADPVGNGLAASLARPAGNVTGLTVMLEELGIKRLEMLREVIPRMRRVAVLRSLRTPSLKNALDSAAPGLRLQLGFFTVSKPEELQGALDRIAAGQYDAILAFEDPIIWTSQIEITQFAAAHRLPGIYGGVKFVRSGGLLYYGPDIHELFRRAAGYVDKILRGAKPADLPIEQPTKFELAVNLKSARALGLDIPESILLRADEVVR